MTIAAAIVAGIILGAAIALPIGFVIGASLAKSNDPYPFPVPSGNPLPPTDIGTGTVSNRPTRTIPRGNPAA
jgi:hypothetical protein